MADITIVNGVYKPTYNWGAPSCGYDSHFAMESGPFIDGLPGFTWVYRT